MSTRFEIVGVPDDLPDGVYPSEILEARWESDGLVIKARYAPERGSAENCLMPLTVNRDQRCTS